ncbi:hypothetical protein S7335_990 [Synechococcus sp. PCC 7335]|uniref:hypothetical protein n=1 Tax=Synechococcus sp. (strain ATCC 29403 / PCC 7335) TaxID=91464 RepID=UPI00017ED685|nr:hypothetical protein [Synechococcus sp. PCC 7335]EDX82688.1 hypothetical protein S7335_990 [Synechococcus sp. PCC 7335]
MAKKKTSTNQAVSLKQMKLIAIKQECYAISGAATTPALKKQYPTLSKNRDFRTRKAWEYVLKRLRRDGEWLGIKVTELESLAEKQRSAKKTELKGLTFSPERVAMDQAAENDD